MSEIVLNEQSLQLMSQFEEITGAGSRDCIIDERNNRLIFVINPGEMGRAIGKQGSSIKSASEQLGMKIEVVEFSTDAEQFLKPLEKQVRTFLKQSVLHNASMILLMYSLCRMILNNSFFVQGFYPLP